MGVLVKRKFLIKKSMFILGAISCLAAVALNASAMGTDYWIVSSGCSKLNYINETCEKTSDSDTALEVNYGLFKGVKSVNVGLSPTSYVIYVYCGEGGRCILSCGKDKNERKQEFDNLVTNDTASLTCTPFTRGKSLSHIQIQLQSDRNDRRIVEDDQFFDNGSWVTTIFFLALTLILQLMSTGLCCFNVWKNPIEWWQGPSGIYGLNTIAVLCNMIHLAVWGGLYSQKLSSQIAIRETLQGDWISEATNLGYSYWLSFVSLVLSILCCVAVYFRKAVQRFEDEPAGMSEENGAKGNSPGVILLY